LQQHEDDKVRLYVTQSTLDELKTLAEQATKHQEYIQQAYSWVQDHAQVVPASSATTQTSNNKLDPLLSETAQDILAALTLQDEHALKYFLASQDDQLLHAARNHAIPCLRLQRTVLLLEQPSKVAELQDRSLEKRKWKDTIPEQERQLVTMARTEEKKKAAESLPTATPASRQRVKKKAKGPNPLSCKRKKTEGEKPRANKRVKT
jgi:rRNA-processing protein FCF1